MALKVNPLDPHAEFEIPLKTLDGSDLKMDETGFPMLGLFGRTGTLPRGFRQFTEQELEGLFTYNGSDRTWTLNVASFLKDVDPFAVYTENTPLVFVALYETRSIPVKATVRLEDTAFGEAKEFTSREDLETAIRGAWDSYEAGGSWTGYITAEEKVGSALSDPESITLTENGTDTVYVLKSVENPVIVSGMEVKEDGTSAVPGPVAIYVRKTYALGFDLRSGLYYAQADTASGAVGKPSVQVPAGMPLAVSGALLPDSRGAAAANTVALTNYLFDGWDLYSGAEYRKETQSAGSGAALNGSDRVRAGTPAASLTPMPPQEVMAVARWSLDSTQHIKVEIYLQNANDGLKSVSGLSGGWQMNEGNVNTDVFQSYNARRTYNRQVSCTTPGKVDTAPYKWTYAGSDRTGRFNAAAALKDALLKNIVKGHVPSSDRYMQNTYTDGQDLFIYRNKFRFNPGVSNLDDPELDSAGNLVYRLYYDREVISFIFSGLGDTFPLYHTTASGEVLYPSESQYNFVTVYYYTTKYAYASNIGANPIQSGGVDLSELYDLYFYNAQVDRLPYITRDNEDVFRPASIPETCHFAGWYTASDGQGQRAMISGGTVVSVSQNGGVIPFIQGTVTDENGAPLELRLPAGSITLMAYWTPDDVELTFHRLFPGSSEDSAVQKTAPVLRPLEETVTGEVLSSQPGVSKGSGGAWTYTRGLGLEQKTYRFDGWYKGPGVRPVTQADLTAALGASEKIYGAADFYAKWIQTAGLVEYRITLILMGETEEDSETRTYPGGSVDLSEGTLKLTPPTEAEYPILAGWYPVGGAQELPVEEGMEFVFRYAPADAWTYTLNTVVLYWDIDDAKKVASVLVLQEARNSLVGQILLEEYFNES